MNLFYIDCFSWDAFEGIDSISVSSLFCFDISSSLPWFRGGKNDSNIWPFWTIRLPPCTPFVCCQFLKSWFPMLLHPFSSASWNLASLPITGPIILPQKSSMALLSISWHPDCSLFLSWHCQIDFWRLFSWSVFMTQKCSVLFIISPFLISFPSCYLPTP